MRFVKDTQAVPRSDDGKGLRVIAAGKWRCATSSLQMAFEQVLQPSLAPSMHGAYLMPSIPRMKLCNKALKEKDRAKRQAMLRDLFDGYSASSDFPGFAFLPDLLDMYPDCKVILNKRSSPEAWEKSVRSSLRFFSTRTYLLITYWIPQSYWHHQIYRHCIDLFRTRYGVEDIFSAECYRRHDQWVHVTAAGRRKQVLEWEPSMGWGPLCEFMGYEVPHEPFPNTNESAVIKELTQYLVMRGLLAWCGVLALLLFFGFATLAILKGSTDPWQLASDVGTTFSCLVSRSLTELASWTPDLTLGK